MLKIEPPDFKFCPMCATQLSIREEEGAKRRHCLGCKWVYYPHVACSACGVAIRDGEVLLVKRAREPYTDTWMFPAGFVSFGEHPSETVVREVQEETGYAVKVIRLVDVLQVDDDPRDMGHFAFMYEVEVSGELKIGDLEENSEVKWWSLSFLPTIGWHSHREILTRLGTSVI